MRFLPIVSRELRVAARRPGTYWLRSIAACIVTAIGAWTYAVTRGEPSQEVSTILFGLLTGGTVLYAALAGTRFTADCISSEKREGTLGLLFLTDLKGYDIVLGKLVANSIGALYALLAVLPVLSIPLMMGGVTIGEFARISLVALDTLLFSLTLGVLVSVLSISAHKAAWTTLCWTLFFGALIPGLGVWYIVAHKINRPVPWFFVTSPAGAFWLAFDVTYRRFAQAYWIAVGVIHGLSWVWLLLASWIIPRTWQDRPQLSGSKGWRQRWNVLSFGTGERRSAFRRKLLEVNPFFWLAARLRLKPLHVWFAFLGAAVLWFWGWYEWKQDWMNQGVCLFTAGLLSLTLKVWVATEAGRQLGQDRHSGALELLLSTPISVSEIIRGQLFALRRQFLGPLLFLLVLIVVFWIVSTRDLLAGDEKGFWACVWGGMAFMLLLDLAALFWSGMWFGLVSRNPNHAAGTACTWVLCLPWVAFGIISLGTLLGDRGPRSDLTWRFYFGLWLVLGIITDVSIINWSRLKLQEDFRAAAVRRFDSKSFWRRVLGG